MKRIIMISLMLSCFFTSFSQAPNWQWIKGGYNGTGLDDYSFTDLGTDNEGNIYGVCRYNGSLQLDTLQWMVGYGGVDFCVVSYTCDGQFRWVKRFGGSNDDFPAGITVMKNGDCIISGNVGWCNWGDAYFADSMVTANNSICMSTFICKLDKNGNIVYLNFPSKQYDFAWVIFAKQEIYPDGNIGIYTWSNDSTTWGNFHIPSKGNYVLKFNSNNGQMIGFDKIDYYGVSGYNSGSDFKIDKNNNYYFHFSSYYWDTLYIGNDTITIDQTSNYHYISTLAKFDSQGNNIWYKKFSWEEPYPYDTAIFGLAIDFAMDENKLYLEGTKYSFPGISFMGFPVNNPIAQSYYDLTIFLLSIDKNNGNANNFINLWNKDYLYPFGTREVKNGKLYAGGIGGGLVLLNNGADTIKPYFTATPQYTHGAFPFIYEIDTGLTHFNWATAIRSYGSGSFDPGSMLIDHNDNIILGTKIGVGLMLPQDTVLKLYSGAYIIKIAHTNDSCGCEASIPSLSLLGTVGNTLTVKGTATNSLDSLYIIWGDGDSTRVKADSAVSHTFNNAGPWNVCLRSYAFCGDRDTCLNGLYAGFEKPEDTNSFISVYPNPTKDKINIVFSELPTEQIELQLFDLMGKMIKNQYVLWQKKSIMDVSGLNKGVYILRITKSGWNKSVKIVKE